jgi:hypothetical protein
MVVVKDGNLAYSTEYAFLLSEGRAFNLPIEVIALRKQKKPPTSEIVSLLNTYYHGFTEMKKKGWINPENRLDENGEYLQEIKNAMLSAEIPYVPLAITKLEVSLCNAKRKDRGPILAELLSAWTKYLDGT